MNSGTRSKQHSFTSYTPRIHQSASIPKKKTSHSSSVEATNVVFVQINPGKQSPAGEVSSPVQEATSPPSPSAQPGPNYQNFGSPSKATAKMKRRNASMACEYCRNNHLRCDLTVNSQICQQCTKRNLVCQFTPSGKRKRIHRHVFPQFTKEEMGEESESDRENERERQTKKQGKKKCERIKERVKCETSSLVSPSLSSLTSTFLPKQPTFKLQADSIGPSTHIALPSPPSLPCPAARSPSSPSSTSPVLAASSLHPSSTTSLSPFPVSPRAESDDRSTSRTVESRENTTNDLNKTVNLFELLEEAEKTTEPRSQLWMTIHKLASFYYNAHLQFFSPFLVFPEEEWGAESLRVIMDPELKSMSRLKPKAVKIFSILASGARLTGNNRDSLNFNLRARDLASTLLYTLDPETAFGLWLIAYHFCGNGDLSRSLTYFNMALKISQNLSLSESSIFGEKCIVAVAFLETDLHKRRELLDKMLVKSWTKDPGSNDVIPIVFHYIQALLENDDNAEQADNANQTKQSESGSSSNYRTCIQADDYHSMIDLLDKAERAFMNQDKQRAASSPPSASSSPSRSSSLEVSGSTRSFREYTFNLYLLAARTRVYHQARQIQLAKINADQFALLSKHPNFNKTPIPMINGLKNVLDLHLAVQDDDLIRIDFDALNRLSFTYPSALLLLRNLSKANQWI